MIRKVEIRNFKVFGEQVFELPRHLVVVGPNNCGKTSLLQAIATWSEIANHWFETNPDFARIEDGNYPVADLNLLRFDAVSLPDFPHLWSNKVVTDPICIWLEAEDWRVGFEIVHSATQLASVRPAKDVREADLERCKEHRPTVVHVPPVSRLPVTEGPYTEDGVRARLRRGRISEVLRNVLVVVSRDKSKWERLQDLVGEFFGYELLAPSAGADVIALYRHHPDGEAYDLSAAASGFLQVLASYAALLFDEASVILIDEPDAHLHLLLQETTYRKLLSFAVGTGSQLVVATHSEVIIRKTELEHLRLLWRGFHKFPMDRRVGNVLRLPNEILMLAETEPGILYVEDESDLNDLREWAQVTGHPLFSFLDKPFWDATAPGRGRDFAARAFGALRRMAPEIKGVELRDGDRNEPKKSPAGLRRLRWRQMEIENYLLHPAALERFVRQERGGDTAAHVRGYMMRVLPAGLFEAPFGATDAIASTRGSDVLGKILQEAGLLLKKTEYYRIAARMRPDEVHPEVREKLDAIATHFGIDAATARVEGCSPSGDRRPSDGGAE